MKHWVVFFEEKRRACFVDSTREQLDALLEWMFPEDVLGIDYDVLEDGDPRLTDYELMPVEPRH